MSETTQPITQRHIPKDQQPQNRHCANTEYLIEIFF
jgi:hypothetical protein